MIRNLCYVVSAWGFWVAVWFPIWMAGELEVPGQQYADPVIPIYICSSYFAIPTYLVWRIWRARRDKYV